MWFLPFLVLGAIAVAAAASRSPRAVPPARQLPPPSSPPPSGPVGVPGPIAVLGEILRIGQMPPPTVIICAIAEAQAIGRNDLASDIVHAFVEPIVRRQQRGMRSAYERGSCAVAHSPRSMADSDPRYATTAPFMDNLVVPPPIVPTAQAAQTAQTSVPATAPAGAQPVSSSAIPSAAPPSAGFPKTDDEIMALLNTDPTRFMQMAAQSRFAPGAPMTPSTAPPVSPEQIVQEQARPLAPGSPLAGIADDQWRRFVALLERESPGFSSQRHVGQFRQRRERLSELGIDPNAIQGSPVSQRMALDADLADAHRHAAAGGMLNQVGCVIPIPGRDAPEKLTLSGLLGVIQSAGLEGAVNWLNRSGDRKRYPHTTQAFLHTNGVF